MMYPSEELITEILRGGGFPGTSVRFPSATADDPAWTHEFIQFHRAIERTDGLCELWVRQRLSALLGSLFARWGKKPGTVTPETGNERAIRRAADYIRDVHWSFAVQERFVRAYHLAGRGAPPRATPGGAP